jgi:hypothetical protein
MLGRNVLRTGNFISTAKLRDVGSIALAAKLPWFLKNL